MKKTTREWVRKAEADLQLATAIADLPKAFHDHKCFLCQQAAEKYLKALLEELSQPVPKIHDLDELLIKLQPFHPTLKALKRGLVFLTDFAVDTRYPGNATSKRQAGSALRWANRVRTACRTVLGVRPPRRRKSS